MGAGAFAVGVSAAVASSSPEQLKEALCKLPAEEQAKLRAALTEGEKPPVCPVCGLDRCAANNKNFDKPVKNYKDGCGHINWIKTCLIFCETSEASEQTALQKVLENVSLKYIEKVEALRKAQKDGEKFIEHDFEFVIVTEPDNQLRQWHKLSLFPPKPHAHPLAAKPVSSCSSCDGCCKKQKEDDKDWFHCEKCDFDFCKECNDKVSEGAHEKMDKMAPVLALADLDSGSYYLCKEEGAAITAEAVEKFLSEFADGKLEKLEIAS
eukprot:TRINITY_DN10611_c0_g1_i1.p1 TRINITY_DN10611_c0_g1~~TRINITY_DN10611_c0_g1_i1.p1  ORF type:complete len:291 (+),score=62.61 TRINITY_DN10611_c0_g1_i1:77-874(+)